MADLVGWSRSASQNVWGGTKIDKARSEPSTAPASPAESDDEEYEADVDYDDVRSESHLMVIVAHQLRRADPRNHRYPPQ